MHIRVVLQQQTDNFIVADFSSAKQWSSLTTENQKNQLG
jgi:hypothetical protein